ncbi:hypothetical protein DdX_09802 [Ditylenchus destructor]|uniref:Uncharacterized protein n=1 Tax=Ditylenchus destructor TaxID=166010 RepID=A0AAD4N5S0_9BILA|nr:hypothetical protein DdX_09802 [Ditylenchus destructor]
MACSARYSGGSLSLKNLERQRRKALAVILNSVFLGITEAWLRENRDVHHSTESFLWHKQINACLARNTTQLLLGFHSTLLLFGEPWPGISDVDLRVRARSGNKESKARRKQRRNTRTINADIPM